MAKFVLFVLVANHLYLLAAVVYDDAPCSRRVGNRDVSLREIATFYDALEVLVRNAVYYRHDLLVDDQPYPKANAVVHHETEVNGDGLLAMAPQATRVAIYDYDRCDRSYHATTEVVGVNDDAWVVIMVVFYANANDYEIGENANDRNVHPRLVDLHPNCNEIRHQLHHPLHQVRDHLLRDHFHPNCFHLECTFSYNRCAAND